MDFLDPQKMRAHSIRLFVGYALMAMLILFISSLLLLVSLGWGYNRKTGEITLNGSLFVDAHPQQAEIFINGQPRGRTDGRFVLEIGNYNVELRREGYRTWKRDFSVGHGQLVRLVYPFMFPDRLESKDVIPLNAAPDLVAQSPDRRWVVMHQVQLFNTLQILDTASDEYERTTGSIPASVLGNRTGTQKLELVEWSTDNRHLLVKYSFEGGYDYLVLDRQQPELSFSISQTFGRSFAGVTLRDKKFDQFYVLDAVGGQLHRAAVRDRVVTPEIASVVAFWPYKDNTLLYATNQSAPEGRTLIKLKEGQATYDIRDVARSEKYLLNYAEFDGDPYLIAGAKTDGLVYVYQDPLALIQKDKNNPPVPVTNFRIEGAEFVTFSGNARFIAIQGDSKLAIYDAETEHEYTHQYTYDSQLKLSAGQKITWMDGHRLMAVSEGKVVVFDFDNLNRQTLIDATAGTIPMFDRDYNEMFTISPSTADKTKPALITTDINLGEEDRF